ncbi:hypothetical protein conserved [Leishmania donovani]|uniref:Uncharacterized protein n=3 Tax=Leishmania donovani species complex TaxID=38574 RepID=A4I8S0_LEIIN|nr:conserved hypothetical protein [Leishmania infantum JPCM5]XP_003863883.1 hypothetical protein, conserved [Leishmania donovani]CAC9530295.1 hypothetical_protein_-_conserved [Leishmania infantum]AYU82027.1 hypothetical protein LdCL_330011400 [Leishmania donovani]TPP53808.1 hypothetical protein CGC21_38295 [Leishmania donovani]TPP55631.1 hypothetical protein CGC20_11125 [Leishmania donovani]CAJ1992023.1 hypothetical protein conserved [Leishmania donovani]|eukprot:XP_001468139.1 conserved hypothetical protein [Leishmania infantum JPCM5]
MGQSFDLLRTHDEVPDDVKAAIPPIKYTAAPEESRPHNRELCEDCGEYFGWFCWSTNCDWCGRQLCARCCPNHHLLGGNPGCKDCTRKAFRIRRQAMLEDHLQNAGLPLQRPRGRAAEGEPITTASGALESVDALAPSKARIPA